MSSRTFKYDYLVVGSGPFGSTFAYNMHRMGKKVLVIEKRNHLAGNIYTKKMNNINIHFYGAHIFHTSNEKVWKFINQFTQFNNYINSPIANYNGEIYNLPFNMNTFNKLWGVITPNEAKAKIKEQVLASGLTNPRNLEEAAILMVGTDIYYKLIKGYTEKQWERSCKDLPAAIIKRLPVRFIYDNNYFNDKYQGIPLDGYTSIVEKMLHGIEVKLNTDYFSNREYFDSLAMKVLYTGAIDEFYDYKLGTLQYRSLRFEHEILKGVENYQGNAVVNYTSLNEPYTRILEHKHFEFSKEPDTVITKEYSVSWKKGDERYYPINDELNNALYEKYRELSLNQYKHLFGGRLAEYKYYDTHITIEKALALFESEITKQ
jgi:UDP-galactopyranose mutase